MAVPLDVRPAPGTQGVFTPGAREAQVSPYVFLLKGRLYRYRPWTVGQREVLEEELFAACGHFDLHLAMAEFDRLKDASQRAPERYQALAMGIRAFSRATVRTVFQERAWWGWRALRDPDAEVWSSLELLTTFFLYIAPADRRKVMLSHTRRRQYHPRAYRLRMAQVLGSPPEVIAEVDATVLDDLALLAAEAERQTPQAEVKP